MRTESEIRIELEYHEKEYGKAFGAGSCQPFLTQQEGIIRAFKWVLNDQPENPDEGP